MGAAVTFVIFGASILTYGLYKLVLEPNSLEYMDLLSFILIIASFVQFVEMFIKKFSPALYKSLGIYLPLITTNCAVLGVALDNIKQGFTFPEMLVYSLGIPIGFTLVLYIFSTIRERLDAADTPISFKGNPIALIVAALMALARARVQEFDAAAVVEAVPDAVAACPDDLRLARGAAAFVQSASARIAPERLARMIERLPDSRGGAYLRDELAWMIL